MFGLGQTTIGSDTLSLSTGARLRPVDRSSLPTLQVGTDLDLVTKEAKASEKTTAYVAGAAGVVLGLTIMYVWRR